MDRLGSPRTQKSYYHPLWPSPQLEWNEVAGERGVEAKLQPSMCKDLAFTQTPIHQNLCVSLSSSLAFTSPNPAGILGLTTAAPLFCGTHTQLEGWYYPKPIIDEFLAIAKIKQVPIVAIQITSCIFWTRITLKKKAQLQDIILWLCLWRRENPI